jgi:hypothetical protein
LRLQQVSDERRELKMLSRDLRGAQSRLAKLRTSVAQQTAVPLVQMGSWRLSRVGAAMAAAAKARTRVNCMLMVVRRSGGLEGWKEVKMSVVE